MDSESNSGSRVSFGFNQGRREASLYFFEVHCREKLPGSNFLPPGAGEN